MIKCVNCNRDIEENTVFCPYCGKQLGKRIKDKDSKVYIIPRIILFFAILLTFSPEILDRFSYSPVIDNIYRFISDKSAFVAITSIIIVFILRFKYKDDKLIKIISTIYICLIAMYMIYVAAIMIMCGMMLRSC